MSELKATGTTGTPPAWLPRTEAEREAVREQVGRILASSHFRNSKRSASLLRCAVEHALSGSTGHPNERTLGVEVFGREPNYDTTQEPVVRMTAVEIRKRLAQYYQAPGREQEIRIDFPQGSYQPEFHRPGQIALPAAEAVAVEFPVTARRLRRLVAALMVGAAPVVVLALWRPWVSETALDRFWYPVLSTKAPLLLCIGSDRVTQPEVNVDAQPTLDAPPSPDMTVGEVLRRDVVRFNDALTLSLLTGFLQTRDKPYRVRRAGNTLLPDLRDGPVVLIGLADNSWTLRLGNQLRFSLASEGGRVFIKDRQNPSNRTWGYDGLTTPVANVQEAYGLISRVLDPTTGSFVVTVAGLFRGTRAAGECLVSPSCIEKAAKLAPGGWEHSNIQILISASLVGDHPGPPRVLLTYVW